MGIHDLWILMFDGVYDFIGKINYFGFSWHNFAIMSFGASLMFSLFIRKILFSSRFDFSSFQREERKHISGFLEIQTKSGSTVTREREYFYD